MSEGFETGGPGNPRSAEFSRDRVTEGGFVARDGSGGATGQPEGIADLLAGLLQDLQELVRGEVQLARTEIREDVMAAGRGVAAIAAGAIFGLTGFIFLMLGVTYLLNIWMRMWIAAAVVGIALAVIAAICVIAGKNKLSASNLKPEQTIDSLKEDREWAKQQMNSVKK